MNEPRDPQVGTLRATALPPRLDPRAGRPPRRSSSAGGASRTVADPGRRPAGPSARRGAAPASAARPERAFGGVLGLTIAGAILPGVGFLAAGFRKLGWLLLACLAVLVGLGAYLATSGKHVAVRLAVSPTGLLIVIAAAVLLAVVWALVVIAQYRVLAPDSTSTGQHLLGSLLVLLLAFGVAAPSFEAAHLAAVQRNLITGLFGGDVQSATVPDSAKADPWGS